MSIADLRREYGGGGLRKRDMRPDPIEQFRIWFEEALDSEAIDVNAMTLATVGPDGVPSARIVLLKGIEDQGFVFYTHYRSQKGREMEESPWAALVFYWSHQERQVRVVGSVEKLSRDESVAYFRTRPRGSQLAAASAVQSSPVESREELERRVLEFSERFQDNVEVPDDWGGYLVKPVRIEFWQGRPDRLHDRLVYLKDTAGGWELGRLAP